MRAGRNNKQSSRRSPVSERGRDGASAEAEPVQRINKRSAIANSAHVLIVINFRRSALTFEKLLFAILDQLFMHK